MRARYILALLGVPVLLREVVLKSKPDSLLALGGRSSVPQLIDEGGDRYAESLDIIFWALSQTADIALRHQLWPKSTVIQHKVKAWIAYNDNTFKYWLDRYKYSDRHPDYSESYYRQKGEIFLRRLETRLNRFSYIFGDKMTLADVALFPFIRQFAAVNSKWFEESDYPKLKIWLDFFITSERFTKEVMEKFTAWEEGDKAIVFPREGLV